MLQAASFVKRTGETDGAAAILEETEPEPPLPSSISADDFSRYVAVDEALQTVEAATDAEICSDVQPTGSLSADMNDLDDEPESETAGCPPTAPPVSFATAIDSLENIRSYLKAAGCQSFEQFYSLMDLIYDVPMQQTAVQTTIKDFFKGI